MTKEELKVHCENQIKICEEYAQDNKEEPSGNIYEEHKLILEILEENEDLQNYIDKAKKYYSNKKTIYSKSCTRYF